MKKLVVLTRLNANLGQVSRPDEIHVLLSRLFRRESWDEKLVWIYIISHMNMQGPYLP